MFCLFYHHSPTNIIFCLGEFALIFCLQTTPHIFLERGAYVLFLSWNTYSPSRWKRRRLNLKFITVHIHLWLSVTSPQMTERTAKKKLNRKRKADSDVEYIKEDLPSQEKVFQYPEKAMQVMSQFSEEQLVQM